MKRLSVLVFAVVFINNISYSQVIGKLNVTMGNNIRAVDKKENAFLNAQNLWCENNPSYLKNHTLSYNFK